MPASHNTSTPTHPPLTPSNSADTSAAATANGLPIPPPSTEVVDSKLQWLRDAHALSQKGSLADVVASFTADPSVLPSQLLMVCSLSSSRAMRSAALVDALSQILSDARTLPLATAYHLYHGVQLSLLFSKHTGFNAFCDGVDLAYGPARASLTRSLHTLIDGLAASIQHCVRHVVAIDSHAALTTADCAAIRSLHSQLGILAMRHTSFSFQIVAESSLFASISALLTNASPIRAITAVQTLAFDMLRSLLPNMGALGRSLPLPVVTAVLSTIGDMARRLPVDKLCSLLGIFGVLNVALLGQPLRQLLRDRPSRLHRLLPVHKKGRLA